MCRYNSNRLPGKILKQINGKAIIDDIMEKLIDFFGREKVIVATSVESTDDIIERHCNQKNYNCFRGSLNDVGSRFLDAAHEMKFDYALRVSGDNYFLNTELLDLFFSEVGTTNFDLTTNVTKRTFGYGLSLELVNIDTLDRCIRMFNESHQEHVTLYFYERQKEFKIKNIYNTTYPFLSGKQLAIDTEEDLNNAKKITSWLNGRKISLMELNNYFKEI